MPSHAAAALGSLLLVVVAVSHISTRIPSSSLEQVVYVPSEEEVLVPVGFRGGESAFRAPRFTMASGPLDSDPSERSLERTEQNRWAGRSFTPFVCVCVCVCVYAYLGYLRRHRVPLQMSAFLSTAACTKP